MSQSPIKSNIIARDVPRALLAGAAILMAFTFIASGAARLTDIGTVHMPPARAVETLALRFVDQEDGGVAVVDARDGSLIHTVAPGTNGFIRGTLRGLARERVRAGIGAEPPFQLTRWSDGTVSLDDSTIGRRIGLDAFGPTNAGAFAQLFDSRSHSK